MPDVGSARQAGAPAVAGSSSSAGLCSAAPQTTPASATGENKNLIGTRDPTRSPLPGEPAAEHAGPATGRPAAAAPRPGDLPTRAAERCRPSDSGVWKHRHGQTHPCGAETKIRPLSTARTAPLRCG